ncbi:hypothetical protein QAD02_013315 [Eretmocerus hayati]|uniref:Uncharacterized protein n=1 Tax=Eretmocerus hayati TaxID=131215 RepID=A0ACC2P230_9HYME|nr:hypothetical protein QAD02_013315 [Eretmocerus hayati]
MIHLALMESKCTNFSTAQFFCRFCEISLDDFRANPLIRKALRTHESYERCAMEAERTGNTVMGVISRSALNELNHFKVIPGLPSCIDHDLYEGIIPKDSFLALKFLITKKMWIKVDILNYRLNSTRLLNEPKIFIPLIKFEDKKKLTGTSSQIRRLLTILPAAMAERKRPK